ncbi:TorD/DmsD family molecular chaperone [Desulfopila aestuarii]|uniref:Chaperone TorD involved in molybdoenzyme TorA maturation n=1 Tax=Desulfopila aestuarii DSM 18488 TaxID=1121416 RepID=A0A1M7Y7Q9_9BACT|nr:molecular chaperone TorD family protein [Desulfopila aestuarii]SHO48662.1 chaperone TorD involved in molybdoenzyme TorA maturation [Desulfopila aestuarii DSM 18488]
MEDFNEREVFRARLRFVDLIKSFFQSEPDAEKMSRWRGTFSALVKEQVNPLFDSAVRDIHKMLNEKNLSEIQNEYYELFTNPFSNAQVNIMASWYLDGRSFGETLVALRSFLAEAGIVRAEGVVDSEDSLPMLLDILASLIEEEKNGGGEKARDLQSRLLVTWLQPLAKELSAAVEKNDTALFYRASCRLLCGYLDLEKGLATAS